MPTQTKSEQKCSAKMRYNSGMTAAGAVFALQYKMGGSFRPYPCSHCSGWHLTTKMRDRVQLPRKKGK